MVERRVYPTTRRFTDPWGFETQLTMSSDPDLYLKVRPYQYARAPRENVLALLKMLGRRERFLGKQTLETSRRLKVSVLEEEVVSDPKRAFEYTKDLEEGQVSDKILNSLPNKKQEELQLMQRESQTSLQSALKESSLLKMLAKLSSLERVAKIVKRKGKYCVISETTGRSFGCYPTKEQAKKRLRQIEFFKHLSKRKKKKSSLELESQTYTDVEMREIYRKMPYEPYLTTYPGKYLPSTDVDTFRRMPMDLLVPIVKRYPSFPTYPRASPVDFLAYPNTLRLGRVRFNPITNTLYCVITWDKPDFVDATDEEIKKTIINYVRDHFRGLREILVDEVKLDKSKRKAILRVEEAFEIPVSHRRVESDLVFDFKDLTLSDFKWIEVGKLLEVQGTFFLSFVDVEGGSISTSSSLSFRAKVKVDDPPLIESIEILQSFVYETFLKTLAGKLYTVVSEDAIENLKKEIQNRLVEKLLELKEIKALSSFKYEPQIELEPLISYERVSGFVVLGDFKIPFKSSIEGGERQFDFKISQLPEFVGTLLKGFLTVKYEEIRERVEQKVRETKTRRFSLVDVVEILSKFKERIKGVISSVRLSLDELSEEESMFLSKFPTSDIFLSRAGQEYRGISDPKELLRFMEDGKHFIVQWRVVGQTLELRKTVEK